MRFPLGSRSFAAFVALVLTAGAAQSSERVELSARASVHADVVTLSDWLPQTAPLFVRNGADAIVLGDTPQLGAERTFARADVLRALRGSSELQAALEIPASIAVTRWSRPLTREEVFQAIARAIAANGLHVSGPFSADDVSLSSPVPVTDNALQLSVERFEPRLDNTGTQVALWIPSQPHTPPFWVTLDRNINAAQAHGSSVAVSNTADASNKPGPSVANPENYVAAAGTIPYSENLHHTSQGVPASRSTAQPSAPLVKTGQSVLLVVQGGGMRITANATALDAGHNGQQIRVRCNPAGKVLVATVVSATSAEIDY